ncbi:MAG: DUF456 domain-containing protein [Anaerolineales bacterium]|nr:DUF456 domain-containing protein [Anaerolineales bacterium]
MELIAAILILAGLLGVVLPVLPGVPLILLGAVVLDYAHQWQFFGWPWLTLLAVLTIIALGADFALSQFTARQGGASWRALAVGVVLGLIGMVLMPPFGLLLGSMVGVLGTELLTTHDSRHALRASGGWLMGWIAGLILNGSIALIMVAIILWRTSGIPVMG